VLHSKQLWCSKYKYTKQYGLTIFFNFDYTDLVTVKVYFENWSQVWFGHHLLALCDVSAILLYSIKEKVKKIVFFRSFHSNSVEIFNRIWRSFCKVILWWYLCSGTIFTCWKYQHARTLSRKCSTSEIAAMNRSWTWCSILAYITPNIIGIVVCLPCNVHAIGFHLYNGKTKFFNVGEVEEYAIDFCF